MSAPPRPEDKRASFQFYMHRTGQWLGMDVPDCGSYVEPSELGPYIQPAAGVPEQFHHIGIRIEDDAIVTATGCELMTRGVPVKAEEIEALMRPCVCVGGCASPTAMNTPAKARSARGPGQRVPRA